MVAVWLRCPRDRASRLGSPRNARLGRHERLQRRVVDVLYYRRQVVRRHALTPGDPVRVVVRGTERNGVGMLSMVTVGSSRHAERRARGRDAMVAQGPRGRWFLCQHKGSACGSRAGGRSRGPGPYLERRHVEGASVMYRLLLPGIQSPGSELVREAPRPREVRPRREKAARGERAALASNCGMRASGTREGRLSNGDADCPLSVRPATRACVPSRASLPAHPSGGKRGGPEAGLGRARAEAGQGSTKQASLRKWSTSEPRSSIDSKERVESSRKYVVRKKKGGESAKQACR